MTEADKPVFAATMNRLCIALRETKPDAPQMRIYFEALLSIEIEFVTMAAERLIAEAQWFPKTSEWRDAAVKIERERTEELIARLRKLPSPLCLVCDDTGWERDAAGVKKCWCRHQRRLEVLGRQPMPALLEAGDVPAPDPTQLERVKAMLAPKGMR